MLGPRSNEDLSIKSYKLVMNEGDTTTALSLDKLGVFQLSDVLCILVTVLYREVTDIYVVIG